MADFMPPAGLPAGGTMTTFRVAAENGPSDASPAAAKSRMAGAAKPAATGVQTNGACTIPLSARRAQPLDLATVERRGYGAPASQPPKPNRMFGLQEAPTYRPTAEQFKDPVQYIRSIREEAQKYGIVKIVPPDSWNPPFAVDTEVSLVGRCASLCRAPVLCFFMPLAASCCTLLHLAASCCVLLHLPRACAQLTLDSASTSAHGDRS